MKTYMELQYTKSASGHKTPTDGDGAKYLTVELTELSKQGWYVVCVLSEGTLLLCRE